MKIYDLHYNALPPEGIERKKAHIVGGGIAGLSAALFLADDCHLPASNIHVYEQLPVFGGSVDGKSTELGYVCRGERELEPYMECFWYLWSKVPSVRHPGRTVLDEVVDHNRELPITAGNRFFVNRGHVHENNTRGLDDELTQLMTQLFFIPETELEGKSIEEYFPEKFFSANLWYEFHHILSFKRNHSIIEAKRYFRRFAHLIEVPENLKGLLHTDLNEQEAMIVPLVTHLRSLGVHLHTDAEVKEILLTDDNDTVTGLDVVLDGDRQTIGIAPEDIVLFTNGSMTQNTTYGDNTTLTPVNRDRENLGVFTVWEKLAARDPKFGKPSVFDDHIDETKWQGFFLTIKDFPEFQQRIEQMSARPWGQSGAISLIDSSWDIGFIPHHTPFFSDQPANVQVLWGYGLYGERPGDYIKKPMAECTGNEVLEELLYHLDSLDLLEGLIEHTYISTAMMPYITSQFMPRHIADRPKAIPDGCTNLGFIGQFVETSEDAVFTVETSVRTAMAAAYRLTGIDKEPVEVYPTYFDIRAIVDNIKQWGNKGLDEGLTVKDLPKPNLLKLPQQTRELVDGLNALGRFPSIFQGREPVPTVAPLGEMNGGVNAR